MRNTSTTHKVHLAFGLSGLFPKLLRHDELSTYLGIFAKMLEKLLVAFIQRAATFLFIFESTLVHRVLFNGCDKAITRVCRNVTEDDRNCKE